MKRDFRGKHSEIKIRLSAADGFTERRSFRTVRGASKYARAYVGDHPERGSTYAISGDGVGKVEWHGCKFEELFPEVERGAPAAPINVTETA